MLWQLQLSLSLCTQCLFICTCLYSLMLHSASSSCLSAFLFPSHQTQQPQPFTVYSLLPSRSPSPLVLPFSNLRPFTISLLVQDSCCFLIFLPSHYLFIPFFTILKAKIPVKFFLSFCTDIETGIRTAHFLFMLGACTWLFLPTLPYLPFEDDVICSHHLNQHLHSNGL